MQTKKCSHCKELRPVTNFKRKGLYKSKKRCGEIRYDSMCKRCVRGNNRSVSQKTRYKKHNYRSTVKHIIREITRNHLWSEEIESFDECSVCKKSRVECYDDKRYLEIHHNDYLNPDDITFLCPDCHYDVDSGFKDMPIADYKYVLECIEKTLLQCMEEIHNT